MLNTIAVENYRSLHHMVMPLSALTLVSGPNGSGKSNLYSALRLLADAARGDVVGALAHEGGLPNTLWAGPSKVSRAMERGEQPVQGGARPGPSRMRLGFSGDDYGYLIELGLPVPGESAFNLDPVIKRECVWHGAVWRQASTLVERQGPLIKRREERRFEVVSNGLSEHASLFDNAGDITQVPEVFALRESIRGWRFYAEFRTDAQAPARRAMPATRTPVLHHDGRDLAAALQTIVEVGDQEALFNAIDDAFPGTTLEILRPADGQLEATLRQPGLLRPLGCREWSDGTLRYLLLVAALLTPRPPALMVLNEPETSLHPDLLPPLARLIRRASSECQVWVVSHASTLVAALKADPECTSHVLEKSVGRSVISGMDPLEIPPWRWS